MNEMNELLSVARNVVNGRAKNITVALLDDPGVTSSGRIGTILIDALERWGLEYVGRIRGSECLFDRELCVMYDANNLIDRLLADGIVTIPLAARR